MTSYMYSVWPRVQLEQLLSQKLLQSAEPQCLTITDIISTKTRMLRVTYKHFYRLFHTSGTVYLMTSLASWTSVQTLSKRNSKRFIALTATSRSTWPMVAEPNGPWPAHFLALLGRPYLWPTHFFGRCKLFLPIYCHYDWWKSSVMNKKCELSVPRMQQMAA